MPGGPRWEGWDMAGAFSAKPTPSQVQSAPHSASKTPPLPPPASSAQPEKSKRPLWSLEMAQFGHMQAWTLVLVLCCFLRYIYTGTPVSFGIHGKQVKFTGAGSMDAGFPRYWACEMVLWNDCSCSTWMELIRVGLSRCRFQATDKEYVKLPRLLLANRLCLLYLKTKAAKRLEQRLDSVTNKQPGGHAQGAHSLHWPGCEWKIFRAWEWNSHIRTRWDPRVGPACYLRSHCKQNGSQPLFDPLQLGEGLTHSLWVVQCSGLLQTCRCFCDPPYGTVISEMLWIWE